MLAGSRRSRRCWMRWCGMHDRRDSHLPALGLELERDREPLLGVVEIEARDLAEPADAIAERVPVDPERRRRTRAIAVYVEVGAEGLDVVGAVLGIVGAEEAKRRRCVARLSQPLRDVGEHRWAVDLLVGHELTRAVTELDAAVHHAT